MLPAHKNEDKHTAKGEVGACRSCSAGARAAAPPRVPHARCAAQFWQGTASGSAVGGSYANWKLGDPNNLGNQDCLLLDDNLGGKWADEVCTSTRDYVCEGDACPTDSTKTDPGQCGCNVPETDTDGDGTPDCTDGCDGDPNKIAPGACGCGASDTDADADGVTCGDLCPQDPARLTPGDCGCSNAPAPAGTPCSDGLCATLNACDGTGTCGEPTECPLPDTDCSFATFADTPYWFCDNDRDLVDARARCRRVGMNLASVESAREDDFLSDHIHEHSLLSGSDQAAEGSWKWLSTGKQFWSGGPTGSPVAGAYTHWDFGQPSNALSSLDCMTKSALGTGQWTTHHCGINDAYVCELRDQCPYNPNKNKPGLCGCNVLDTDTDADGTPDCLDECPQDSTHAVAGDCGCPSAPAATSTTCDDGVCDDATTCDGQGRCGNPALCQPDSNCTYKRDDGRTYWFCSNARTWTDARNRCRSQPDVDLAAINDADENKVVARGVNVASWLGGNDRDSNGHWRWAARPFDAGESFWTGTAAGVPTPGAFTAWKPSEPSGQTGEDCLYASPGSDRQLWLDGSCAAARAFVCEQPMDLCKNNPAKRNPGVCGCDTAETDSDSDGRPDCKDNCPLDPLRFEPGDCGCVGKAGPAPAGTACDDGVCSANNQCNGAGSCGSIAQCAPDTNCTASVRQRHVYWSCRNDRSWSAASGRCVTRERTRLAQLDTADENDFLTGLVSADSWIGGTDSAQEGAWLWTGSGQQFWSGGVQGSNKGRLAPWDVGEPNDLSAQDCALSVKSTGRWTDRACTDARDFACETCVRLTCADLGAECGTADDGCGGTLNCTAQTGGCGGSEVCFPAANHCSAPDGDECRELAARDPSLPLEDGIRQLYGRYIACSSVNLDRCQAAFLGALRDDDVRTARACREGTISPSDHNTLNFDRNDKKRTAELDPTYACRVANRDVDHDLVPDDIDQCLDTPPRTATLASGCTDPAKVPGPDADHLRFIREHQAVMYDPECTGMSMGFEAEATGFFSGPPPGSSTATLLFKTIFAPQDCELFFEFRGDALLANGSHQEFHFLFRESETTVSHAQEVSYIEFSPSSPGERGALAQAAFRDLVYTIRVRNGNGGASRWSEPLHAEQP